MKTMSRPRMVRRHDVTNIPAPTDSSRDRAPHRPAVPSLPPREKEPRHRRIATSTNPSHTSVAQTVAQTEMIDYAKWLGMDL